MADLTAIREGLAQSLSAIPGFQVSAYMLANPTPPVIQVLPGTTIYDRTMQRGLDEITMRVQAFVATNLDIGSQVNLDRLLDGSGTSSVKTVLETDKTLGGATSDLHVTGCTGYQQYKNEGQPSILMAEWTVVVRARGA